MKYHGVAELRRFLRAVDDALPAPMGMVVIGGAAAALHHGAHRQTADIDTFHTLPPELEQAIGVANLRTGLGIPVSFAAIADAPWDFEDRLEQVKDLSLQRLSVVVPERHDLALMKVIRGYEHDLQVIDEIHRHRPLLLETLVNRFKNEMSHVVADPRNLRVNFSAMIGRTFGATAARGIQSRLDPAGEAN